MPQRLLTLVLGVLLLLGGPLLGGCQPAKKPLPSSPRATTPRATKKAPSQPSQARLAAERVAREVVKISGVQRATVVVSGRTAFIGLDLRSGVTKEETTALKNEAARRAKKAEPGLKMVHVTADPDLVARLKRVADGIKQGRPVSSFASELAEIARRITPKSQ